MTSQHPARPYTSQRDSRLSRGLSGTNLERAGDYNLRTVLQVIRFRRETTRIAVAQATGLTPPTIANITARLTEMGLVRTAGRLHGARGQPALKLQLEPDGAFGIGLTIDRDHLALAIVDLGGKVRARASREIAFPDPDDVLAFLAAELEPALAAGRVDRARVLGVGVAMPDDPGRTMLAGQPPGYARWETVDLDALFGPVLPWPIHRDNDAAAAALGEAQYDETFACPSFFYLLISAGLGGGLVIDRTYHRGAHGRSGEIGLMPDPGAARPGARVQDTVSLSALRLRLAEAGCPIDSPRGLAGTDDPAAIATIDQWIADSVRALLPPFVAIANLFDPDAILIGGRLPLPLIRRLSSALAGAMAAIDLPTHPAIRPAHAAEDAPAIGAATLPFLDRLLPCDAILIQAGRG
ncbi:ROK family protein [Sphingomonadaceae bacterium jetA1]|jgi:predicted NBD/HSP70 family sugar kinase|uniref:ROK family protein n=1 Tax=Facivitalis istanbulensis TaxID=3075838 RepID=UPI00346D2B99